MRRFAVYFALVVAGFYCISLTGAFQVCVFEPYLRWNAAGSAWLLNLIYSDVRFDGVSIIGSRFAVQIHHGCDALEPTALLIAAVAAFPAARTAKVIGIVAGASILAIVNVARIASLFMIGIHAREWFAIAHSQVWQAGFIILVVGLWLAWVHWFGARRGGVPACSQNAPSPHSSSS